MCATVEDIQDFERIIQQRAQGMDPIFFKAPVLLLAHVPVEDSFGRDDATYAAYNIILAAHRMGLGNCLIGYFIYALENNGQLRRRLGLPDNRRVEVALVIGYPEYQFRRTVTAAEHGDYLESGSEQGPVDFLRSHAPGKPPCTVRGHNGDNTPEKIR